MIEENKNYLDDCECKEPKENIAMMMIMIMNVESLKNITVMKTIIANVENLEEIIAMKNVL